MPFMVIYSTSDGASCHEQADAIDEAPFVERLRNQEGIEEIRIYRMEEISFAFRRTTRSSSGCRSGGRHAAAEVVGDPSPPPMSPGSSPPVDACAAGGGDVAPTRRSATDANARPAVRPLTAPGHPSAWSISAAIARASSADQPRPRATPRPVSSSASSTPGAQPSPPAPIVSLDDLARPPRLPPPAAT